MRPVPISEISEGAVAARRIFGSDGSILLEKGMNLSPRYAERLGELGISEIFIEDPATDGIEVSDIIDETLRARTVKEVFEILQRCLVVRDRRLLQGLDFSSLKSLVNEMIDELSSKPDASYGNISINPTDSYTTYTAFHSVSTTVLAILVGIRLGYRTSRLAELGYGHIVHDLGKARIGQRPLYKPGRLTDEEFAEIKKHPNEAYLILRENDDIPPRSALIALQHHEKPDGSGYPRGLSGEKVNEFARISAVVDIFDALTSERIYKPKMPFAKAFSILSEEAEGGKLDPEILAVFGSIVPEYPVGSMVRLARGQEAIVSGYENGSGSKPILRILTDPGGGRITDRREIEISRIERLGIEVEAL